MGNSNRGNDWYPSDIVPRQQLSLRHQIAITCISPWGSRKYCTRWGPRKWCHCWWDPLWDNTNVAGCMLVLFTLWQRQSVIEVWQRCDQSAVDNCGCGQWLPGPPRDAIFSATPGWSFYTLNSYLFTFDHIGTLLYTLNQKFLPRVYLYNNKGIKSSHHSKYVKEGEWVMIINYKQSSFNITTLYMYRRKVKRSQLYFAIFKSLQICWIGGWKRLPFIFPVFKMGILGPSVWPT